MRTIITPLGAVAVEGLRERNIVIRRHENTTDHEITMGREVTMTLESTRGPEITMGAEIAI